MKRFAILTVGSFLLFTCSDIWNRTGPFVAGSGIFQLATWALLLSGLFLLGVGATTKKPARWDRLLLALVLVAQWTLYASYAVKSFSHEAPSDTVLVSLHAAVLSVLDQNPYTYNMNDVYSAYDATAQAMTPHLDGGQVEKFPYPALHFQVMRPLLGFGVEGARFFYSAAFSFLIIILYLYCPKEHRTLVLLPLIANPEFVHYPFYWSSDSIWTLLLALTLYFWKQPVARAVFLGLACAFKQNPWIFAPFLAIRVLKEEEKPWPALAKFVGISIATFAVVNMPYLWLDFGAWFAGTFDPMLSPYVPLGRGLSTLTQTGLLPFAKGYYSTLTYLAFLCSLCLYFVDYQRLRPLLWLFPALILFFSYRSMAHYFIYTIPLLSMELSRSFPELKAEKPHRYWYAPIASFLAGFSILTIIYWPGASEVELKIVPSGSGGMISKVEVEVTNNGKEFLKPTFFGRTGWRTYPWRIADGPLGVRPGESERFQVVTDLTYRSITATTGGQILLTDGTDTGRYLALATIPPLDSFRKARGIDEPNPYSWSIRGPVEFETDQVTLETTRKRTEALVVGNLMFPYEPLRFELKRPENLPAQAFFGLQLRDNLGQQISLVLGSQDSQGFYNSGHFYKTLGSKPGWNSYEVNLRDLYQEAKFKIPPVERVLRQNVVLLDRPMSVTFQLHSDEPITGAAVRKFQVEATQPGRHIAELLFHEDQYKLLLADVAARRRKFDEAMELYSELWPFEAPVRVTQEGRFLVIPKPHVFKDRFPLAGTGWAEPEGLGRPIMRKKQPTIELFAKPGLKLEIVFDPPTGFRYQWEGETFQQVGANEPITVPAPAAVRTLTLEPQNRKAKLRGITAR